MSVNSTVPILEHILISTGSTRADFRFPITATEDIKVQTGETLTTLSVLTEDVDYTVTLNNRKPGGRVDFTTAPTKDHYIKLTKSVNLSRDGTPATVTPNNIEISFDEVLAMMVQVNLKLDRALKLGASVDTSSLESYLSVFQSGFTGDPVAWGADRLYQKLDPIEIDLLEYDYNTPVLLVPDFIKDFGLLTNTVDYTIDHTINDIDNIQIDTKAYNYTLFNHNAIDDRSVGIDQATYTYTLQDVLLLPQIVIDDTQSYNVTYDTVTINDITNEEVSTKAYTLDYTLDHFINQEEIVSIDTKSYSTDFTLDHTISNTTFDVRMDLRQYNYDLFDPLVLPAFDKSGLESYGAQAAEVADGTITWDSIANTTASDDARAEATGTWDWSGSGYGDISYRLYTYDFPIDIPDSKTVTGIEVITEAQGDPTVPFVGTQGEREYRVYDVYLMDGASTFTGSSAIRDESQVAFSTDTRITTGSAVTMSVWGSPSITGADVNASTFGVGCTIAIYNNETGSGNTTQPPLIDAISVKIYYDDSDVETRP